MVDGLAELEKSLWMLLWRWMCGVAHAKLQRCFDTKTGDREGWELGVSIGVGIVPGYAVPRQIALQNAKCWSRSSFFLECRRDPQR